MKILLLKVRLNKVSAIITDHIGLCLFSQICGYGKDDQVWKL